MAGHIYALVVDDDHSSLLVMSRTVFQAGYTPVSASDGQSGWLLAEGLSPKVIITDLDMSPWGGLRLIEAIRTSKNPAVRETPIIVCSATDDLMAKKTAIEAGATRFIKKPIRILELCDLIVQVVTEKTQSWKSRKLC